MFCATNEVGFMTVLFRASCWKLHFIDFDILVTAYVYLATQTCYVPVSYAINNGSFIM
jgi:hypothetical protein